jgi:hypothetical protein
MSPPQNHGSELAMLRREWMIRKCIYYGSLIQISGIKKRFFWFFGIDLEDLFVWVFFGLGDLGFLEFLKV